MHDFEAVLDLTKVDSDLVEVLHFCEDGAFEVLVLDVGPLEVLHFAFWLRYLTDVGIHFGGCECWRWIDRT